MKTYWRLLAFGRPIGKYAIPYFLFVIPHTIFNTFTYALIIPILNTLFQPGRMLGEVTEMPSFEVSQTYFDQMINFILYKAMGTGYGIEDVLILLSVFVIVAMFLNNLFRYLAARVLENLRIHTLEKMRNDLFSSVVKLQVSFFSNERKGDIISKITADVQVVQFCITNTLQVFFKEPLLIAGYMILLIWLSPSLTLFTLLMLPLSGLVIGGIVKRLRRKATAAQESYSDIVSLLDEVLGAMKIIKAYNAAKYVTLKFLGLNKQYSDISRSMAYRQQLASPVSEFLGVMIVAFILIYGGNLVMGGDLSASGFLAYIAAFSQLTRPVKAITDSFTNINQGLAAGERILELMDTEPMILDKEDAKELTDFNRSIEFRDVNFSYDSKEILKGVSFTIEKGQTVALVGPSGGGKSTISDLIPRFYDVKSGSILIDGVDIRDYKLSSIRQKMGIVAQDTVLFNDSIEENIKLGSQSATLAEVQAAAKIANADAFILETDSGYQTNIGDRGMKLSGGQRQRLSIARAVLKNPDILILDEATSALDTESEQLVQQALTSILKGRTSLIIAHRLSTIQHADKIVVVEQGRIVQQGTHHELMQVNGLYKRLIEMQQLG